MDRFNIVVKNKTKNIVRYSKYKQIVEYLCPPVLYTYAVNDVVFTRYF